MPRKKTPPALRFLIAGTLRRDTIITPADRVHVDIPGGSLYYSAAGMAVWDQTAGLISRIGEDYPLEWLNPLVDRGFDIRGITVIPQTIDTRAFFAFQDGNSPEMDNPIAHFTRLGMPFPKELLGYSAPLLQLENRNTMNAATIRPADIPPDYLDATTVHLAPIDFLSHRMLPSALKQGHIHTISMEPSDSSMNPAFWDDIAGIIKGVTVLIVPEYRIRNLFQGKTTDLWEMAETLASFGSEFVIIREGGNGQRLLDGHSGRKWQIPAYPARVTDPLGAGDAFCGGFLVGYQSSFDPVEGALYGNISASFAVEGTGPTYALDAMPGLALARLEALRDKIVTV